MISLMKISLTINQSWITLITIVKSRKILTGSGLLFLSSILVNLGNYAFNIVLGRWMGPQAFSDLSLFTTLGLIASVIVATIQLVSARYAATEIEDLRDGHLGHFRHILVRWTFGLGVFLAACLIFSAGELHNLFRTQSYWPFVLFGLGLPLFFIQGVDRGILQGQTNFKSLAFSYQIEIWTRLITGIGLVMLGAGIIGAVGSIPLSYLATWLSVRKVNQKLPVVIRSSWRGKKEILKYALPVIVVYASQVLINNSDVVAVKMFFPPQEAGEYAALALIGRVVYFSSWPLVMSMFPIVAGRDKRGESHGAILWYGILFLVVISLGVIGASLFYPDYIVKIIFGKSYLGISNLLWKYALATSMFSIVNYVANYRLALRQSNGAVFLALTSMIQVFGLGLYHSSLKQVVLFQVILMTILLSVLLLYEGKIWLTQNPKVAYNLSSDLSSKHSANNPL